MRYTRAAVGKGNLTEDQDPKTMDEPADYVMDAKITAVTTPIDGECQITVQISSKDVSEGFYCTGIVLYAEDPDDGEVPFTYMVLENEPEWIRPKTAVVGKLATFDLIAAVGAVDSVTAAFDPDSILTRKIADKIILSAIDAHNSSNEAHQDLSYTFTVAKTRNNIASGETMAVLLGKIAKWFSDLSAVAFSGKYSDLMGDILNVGNRVQIRTDAEGGNIRITSPDGTFYAEMDAYNNATFRIYTRFGGKEFQALRLGKDAESTSIHGTSDKVAHALSFSGGAAGSYDGSEAKTVKIPNTAADVSALPSCVSIPSNADLNEYTTEGIYGCTTNAIASTIKNSPTSISFALLVIPRGKGENAVQLLVNSAGTICTRAALSSGWGAWVKATSEPVSSDPGAVDGPSAFDQLRADVDYIAAMQGVEL